MVVLTDFLTIQTIGLGSGVLIGIIIGILYTQYKEAVIDRDATVEVIGEALESVGEEFELVMRALNIEPPAPGIFKFEAGEDGTVTLARRDDEMLLIPQYIIDQINSIEGGEEITRISSAPYEKLEEFFREHGVPTGEDL